MAMLLDCSSSWPVSRLVLLPVPLVFWLLQVCLCNGTACTVWFNSGTKREVEAVSSALARCTLCQSGISPLTHKSCTPWDPTMPAPQLVTASQLQPVKSKQCWSHLQSLPVDHCTAVAHDQPKPNTVPGFPTKDTPTMLTQPQQGPCCCCC
jgi:hypothetical protein